MIFSKTKAAGNIFFVMFVDMVFLLNVSPSFFDNGVLCVMCGSSVVERKTGSTPFLTIIQLNMARHNNIICNPFDRHFSISMRKY